MIFDFSTLCAKTQHRPTDHLFFLKALPQDLDERVKRLTAQAFGPLYIYTLFYKLLDHEMAHCYVDISFAHQLLEVEGDICSQRRYDTFSNEVLAYTGKLEDMLNKMDFDGNGSVSIEEFNMFFVALYNAGIGKSIPVHSKAMSYIERKDEITGAVKQYAQETDKFDEVQKGRHDVEGWLAALEKKIPVLTVTYQQSMEDCYGASWESLTREQRKAIDTDTQGQKLDRGCGCIAEGGHTGLHFDCALS